MICGKILQPLWFRKGMSVEIRSEQTHGLRTPKNGSIELPYESKPDRNAGLQGELLTRVTQKQRFVFPRVCGRSSGVTVSWNGLEFISRRLLCRRAEPRVALARHPAGQADANAKVECLH